MSRGRVAVYGQYACMAGNSGDDSLPPDTAAKQSTHRYAAADPVTARSLGFPAASARKQGSESADASVVPWPGTST